MTDFNGTDQVYGWSTANGQFYQTWADFKAQIESEITDDITLEQVRAALNVLEGNIDFNNNDIVDLKELGFQDGGAVSWNSTFNTIDVDTGLGPVLQVGQELYTLVYNNTGDTLLNGTVVYSTGQVSGIASVDKALSDTYEKLRTPNYMTTMDIPDGTLGFVTFFGYVRGVDTSAVSAGDLVYVSDTVPGAFTATPPEFPSYQIQVGRVVATGVTDGALFVNVVGRPAETIANFFSGTFRETFAFRITSDGTTITGSVEPEGANEDMTMIFSDGLSLLQTTPPATITLPAGTDVNPQVAYVYVPSSTRVLTTSTSWPAEEHIKVAVCTLQSAATTQTNGALKNQNWNDHLQGIDGQGHLSHVTQAIRDKLDATWKSGVEPSVTINTGATPDDVFVVTTGGTVMQLHDQTFPAQDMSAGDDIHIVNDPVAAYTTTTNLNTITTDSNGGSLSNQDFSVVVWGAANKSGEPSHLFLNLPSNSYGSTADALEDADNYSNYTIPSIFQGVGFLIARFTFSLGGGLSTWTLAGTDDLRGFVPNSTAGGGGSGGGGGGATTLLGLTDTPSAYTGLGDKPLKVNAGATGTEFANISAADVDAATDKNFVTDAEAVVIGNTSGTNTGDQDLSGYLNPTTHAVADVEAAIDASELPSSSNEYVTKDFGDGRYALSGSTPTENLATIKALVDYASPTNGLVVSVTEFFSASSSGGGVFTYSTAADKADADGGLTIDPSNVGTWDGTQAQLAAQYYGASGQGTGTGIGCWLRQEANSIPEEFGALGDGVVDDFEAIDHFLWNNPQIKFLSETYRVSALPDFSRGHAVFGSSESTLKVDDLTGLSNQVAGETISLSAAGGLTIQGAAPVDTSFSSITSVTGTEADWSVTATLADASDLAVGDIIKVSQVSPGIGKPGLITGAPPNGQINLGFFQMGEIDVTGTAVTTDPSVSYDDVTDYISVGDFMFVRGQVRRIVAVAARGFTLSSVLADDIINSQYWYYIPKVGASTISSMSGTTITGTTTNWLSSANDGDIIFIDGYGMRRIVSVDSNTQITVNEAVRTVATATNYTIYTPGEIHEGCWEVTAVNTGTGVTTWKSTIFNTQPPVNNVSAGTVTKLPTQVQTVTDSDGMIIKDNTLNLIDIVFTGQQAITSGARNIGINLQEGGSAGKAVLNGVVCIHGYGYGVWGSTDSSLNAASQVFCANAYRGVNMTEGATAWLEGATINGNNGFGKFIGPGTYARLTDARLMGNNSTGLRFEVGGASWMDFGYACYNGSDGVLGVGGVTLHLVGGRFIGNVGSGFEGQNGIFGRASGAICLCNTATGMTLSQGWMEANQAQFIGNEQYGTNIQRSSVSLEEAGIGSSASFGLYAYSNSSITIRNTQIDQCLYAITARNNTSVVGSNIGIADSATYDAHIETGGQINLTDVVSQGTANFDTTNETVGELQANLGLIQDGSVTAPINGGSAGATFFSTSQVVANSGWSGDVTGTAINANGQGTATITISGLALSTDWVASVNLNGTYEAGIIYTARVSAVDTVEIRATNPTNSAITMNTHSFYVAGFDPA